MSKLLDIANGELGNTEANKGDDKYIKWYGGFALNVAWCAIFVSWCAAQAGIPRTIIPKFASCDAGVKWFKARGKYMLSKAYGGTYTPKPNDIVFFSSVETQDDATHVGYATHVKAPMLHTVEGNSKDAVRSRVYKLDSKYIIGYGVVDLDLHSLKTKPTLRRGDRGEIVRLVQELLISSGYSCGVYGADGEFGGDTEAAVIRYQKEIVGLKKPNGIISSATWKSLIA